MALAPRVVLFAMPTEPWRQHILESSADLRRLLEQTHRIAVLGKKRVLVEGTVEDMLKSDEPWVKSYFRGKRARQLDLDARASS